MTTFHSLRPSIPPSVIMTKMSYSLIICFFLLHICRAAILSPEFLTTPPTPMPDPESPRGGCEYDGEHYEPGIIRKEVDGQCETIITCEEWGEVHESESIGCYGGEFVEISDGEQ